MWVVVLGLRLVLVWAVLVSVVVVLALLLSMNLTVGLGSLGALRVIEVMCRVCGCLMRL